jgi:hypothetical protein
MKTDTQNTQQSALSIEVTPEMVAEMKEARERKGFSLYALQKRTKLSYNTICDIFSDNPKSNYRHRSKMEKVYKELGLKLPE